MTAYRNKGNKFLSTSALTLGLLAAGTTAALAMDDFTTPTGEQVVGGAASFDRPDAGTLNINQSTDRAVINWDSFNIGEKAKTEFFQPGSGSLAVNRVTGKGTDPTQILGTLKANGRVMVLDRNGVIFGANSRTDVGGIVASTGDVDNNAVMRGDTSLELSNFGDKSVINNGTISVSGAGLAALVAPHTANNGVIEAKLGKVALASGGERATVDLYGDGLVEIAVGGAKGKALAENNGTIEGATVLMTASGAKEVVDTVINMNGVIKAGSVTQKGGKIILNGGSAGMVKVTGTLDTSGANGGGEVNVTGEDINVTESASVFADALNHGNGGLIYFMGSNNALYRGRFYARGGEESGNGGFVELSAKNELGYDGSVNTTASGGSAGSFLLDPRFALIHSGTLDGLTGDIDFISAAALANDLLNNASVTVLTTDYIDVGTNAPATGVGTSAVDVSAGATTTQVLTGYIPTDKQPGDSGYDGKLQGCNSGGTPGAKCAPVYATVTTPALAAGNLVLQSAIVNFNKTLIMGTGNLSVLANTVNLGAAIQSRGFIGDPATLMNTARISGTASLVNVKSNAARINQGIALAQNGGTVDVFAGNYAQDGIIINKALTLLGAGNGQTVLTESPLVITASGVAVDGFTMTKAVSVPNFWSGSAVWIQGVGGTNAADTRSNYIIGDNGTNRGGNTITGNYYAGIYLSGGNINGITIVGNTITGAYDGIENNFSTNGGKFSELSIQKNTISGGSQGMGLNFLAGNNAVTNNFISATNGAIWSSGSANNATLRVYNNSFSGSAGKLVENGNSFTINASNNWWGTTNEATIASKMSGSVDFTPYLLSGTDVSAAPGFRGDFSNLFVTALGAQTGPTGRVQEGVNNALVNGTVNVGAGTFNGAVAVSKTLTLLGANNGVAGFGVRGAESVIAPNSPGFNVTADNVTIDGFTVDGASGADGYGIWINNANNAVIKNNIITGSAVAGVFADNGNGAKIRNNLIYNTVNGVAANTAGTLSVKNNVIYQVSGNAIDINNSGGAKILGNAIGYTDLAGTASAGAGNVTGDGIRVSGSDGVTIGDYGPNEGNKIGDANNGIVVLSGNDIEIIKNVIANSANDGINLSGLNVTLSGEYDNHIFRNDITGSGRNGITVADSSYVLIGGHGDNSWNTITNSGWDGVNVSGGDHVTVRKNTIQTVTGASGVAVSDSIDAQVSENTISDTNHTGIYAYNANRIDIENNIISNTGLENSGDYLSGIHVEDSNKAVITGNTVNYTNSDGIRVKGSNNLLIEANILSGIHKSGINVRNANGVARLNADSGENFNLIIRDNNVGNTDNGDGIRVRNAGNVLISENRIGTDGAIGGNGVYVYDSGYSRIAGNAVNNANDDGIRAAGNFDVEITGNNISFSGDDGIDLYDNVYTDTNDNVVLFSGDDGIYVEGTHSSSIRNNNIILSGDDGIDVWGGYETVIRGNFIAASVDDGIVVEGTGNPDYLYDYEDYGYGGGEGPDWTVKIVDNKIALSGHHGIAAYNTGSLRIARNEVALSGTDFTGWLGDLFGGIGAFGFESGDETESYFFALGWGDGDGVHVENAYRYEYYDGGDYETRFSLGEGRTRPAVSIVNNDVRWTGGDGIDVSDSGTIRIAGNNVDNTGIGLTIFDLEAVFEHLFTLDFEQVFMGLNDVVNGEDGSLIALLDYVLPTPEFTLRDNGSGIRLDGNERARLLSNVISNSGAAGLYAAGAYNGQVVLADNTFNGNPVGAWFESGEIDLTGDTNIFNGGEVGLLFSPVEMGGRYERFFYQGEVEVEGDYEPSYAPLSLVDDTIGTTEFNGQSSYYIVLENGALFAPGAPTVINGMNASFDGFAPSTVGGILSAGQFNALEGMIHHYNDESTLGLIFFGAVPSDTALGDDDVYNNYSGPNWSSGRFRMTLLGLPNLPGSGNGGNDGNAGGQGGFFGNVADFLANLAPAAGGDDNGKKKNQPVNIAGQLADLEPAAGDQEDPACWSDAVAQAQGGATVNYSFGGTAEESLNQAAACGGSI